VKEINDITEEIINGICITSGRQSMIRVRRMKGVYGLGI